MTVERWYAEGWTARAVSNGASARNVPPRQKFAQRHRQLAGLPQCSRMSPEHTL
jgi:hypothetical protein